MKLCWQNSFRTLLSAIDIVICIVAAHFIFEVPMRGSLFSILFASFLYLIVSLLLGLTISGFAQKSVSGESNCFVGRVYASTDAFRICFDTRNLPLVVQIISQLLPATHFMVLIKTLWEVMIGGYGLKSAVFYWDISLFDMCCELFTEKRLR